MRFEKSACRKIVDLVFGFVSISSTSVLLLASHAPFRPLTALSLAVFTISINLNQT